MARPKVFVIVLNRNLRQDLAECLASLVEGTYPHQQIVVVDNASDDGSVEMVKDQFRSVHVLTNERNLGFAGGNNVGLRYALERRADYILLLNNDTVVAPDTLERLMGVVREEPSLGIIGPKILYHGTENRVWYLGHRRSPWLPVPRRVNARLGERRGDPAWFDVDYVSGCGMLIKREVLETVGCLDEGLFMHYEDADLCQRAQQAGYRLACVPRARMWHKVSQSSRHEQATVRRAKARNRLLFYRRYPHGPHPWLTVLFLLLSAGAIMMRDLACGRAELVRPHALGMYEAFTKRSID